MAEAFHRVPRVALSIDGAHLWYASSALGMDIDFGKLCAAFRDEGVLVRATYYALISPNNDQMRPLLDWLAYNGYAVKEKVGKEFVDATGRRQLKGSIAMEMAVDAFELAPAIDRLILFSGSGDMRRLVHAVQGQGIHVTAVSTPVTRPSMIASELRRQADGFLDLADLLPRVQRSTPRPARKRG